MYSKVTMCLMTAMAVQSLYGESGIGILSRIESNERQTLLYHNRPVACEPFGILTLERMVRESFTPDECRKEVEKYYTAHPHARHFARERLYRQHGYRFERIKGGCVLYANGAESYGEMVLSEGLAIVDPKLDDREWRGRLKRIESGALQHQKGLHDTQIRKFCIKEEK